MKKLSFLALAAVGLLLGACSSDKEVADEVPVVNNAAGEGYIGFSIQLPSANNVTRANDDFNNGKQDEFLINNARLILFEGDYDATDPVGSANDAVFYKAYSFEGIYENDTQGEDAVPTTKITSTSVAVAKIDKYTPTSGKKLFAYVVLNHNGSALQTPAAGESFENFSKKTVAASYIGGDVNGNIDTGGLLMTSSPVSDVPGGNADPTNGGTVTPKVTTAAVLDETNIKTTKAEAKNAPAGCIYVERAAAKVTVTSTIATANQNITMGSETVPFAIEGWQIINTEPNFYNTRQCENAWLPYISQYVETSLNSKYRFVTKDAFAPTIPSGGHTTAYRTYFAKDIQYNADATGMVNTVANVTGTWNALSDRAFIPENTFDVAHQTWRNTTQVTLRVKFNGGTGFYTLSDDAAKYDKTNAENKLHNNIVAINEIRTWLSSACQDISAEKTSGGNKEVTSTLTVTINSDVENAGAKTYEVSVKFTDTSTSTDYAVSDITDTTIKGDWSKTDGIKATAEAFQTVTFYKGGYAYYNVRIKHFGDVETPWSSDNASALGTSETEYTVNHIYGWDDSDAAKKATANKNFLGRYGIVRDNWYQLTISGISKLGTATPTDVSDKNNPDDEVQDEYYISAHVHILPWVIRQQSVEL